MKGPASQPQLPDLLPLPLGSDSSDGLEEEKEAKRPRSTSTTPRSGKGLEPYEYNRHMGATSVGSSSEEIGDDEGTEVEETENKPQAGVTNDSLPGHDSSSVVAEGSRGIGSASLLEVLGLSRIPRFEIPAACASQGAMDLLGVGQNPEQRLVHSLVTLLVEERTTPRSVVSWHYVRTQPYQPQSGCWWSSVWDLGSQRKKDVCLLTFSADGGGI